MVEVSSLKILELFIAGLSQCPKTFKYQNLGETYYTIELHTVLPLLHPGIDTNPGDGFAKLQYLLSQNPFPPETFANLLLLYCKYEVGC